MSPPRRKDNGGRVAGTSQPNGRPANGVPRAPAPVEDTSKEQTDENIFLFVPNLIGYARIILCIASLYFMPLHPRRCSFLYSISCLMDALDGIAARQFQQSTKFGAVLDMVTDRCTTTCLLVFLSTAKPAYSMIFQGLISLDLASHYMHMYATLSMGGKGESHKNVSAERSWIMNKYYTNKTVLFTFCALNELFFIALYLLCFSSPLITPALLPTAGLAAHQATSPVTPHQPAPSLLFPSPFSAGAMEMARANKMDSMVPWILTLGSAPVMFVKQWINVLQLVKASQWLAEGDRMDRMQALKEARRKGQ
ncbi:phosphatidylinositol synthase 1 (CDP-alcohol phosphatidyltransferase1) [Friedmanniomyces endolithicus]|nr:phosphatidylinositol synthase 1 (CDP-alcohol phosphatidyltransferase1) [Friedmanniomyces endolithicus]KAK0280268.1 phosphatidylinositol synthase 1 (CDP-alcohol phosphatidyltransferase1) [Friedmanniomyces endolithicus]KAK0312968.1 phosphatidylinositol synthase 1 (CDP-alcohol phosphatidyltransferase1) [Friedmanniomyces endolithicus]KAK1053481.1 phosphatidylinositol synthase 1 (CDP-alcohol phosphatidyltransferase1) [Friedmanniomyces endolithicus]